MKMSSPRDSDQFEVTVLVHLDSAFNLARWILRDQDSAEDAVQESCLRALRFFKDMSGPNPKAWFLAIVRNACMDWLRGSGQHRGELEYEEDKHGEVGAIVHETPETSAMRASDARWLHVAIAALPLEFREVIILRELEEMTYKEISAVIDVPIGTVMSRLSRGRDLLSKRLHEQRKQVRA
jgi:RNA polymerase sigma-70 factor, ECF subfamily